MTNNISVILPARNEATALSELLPDLINRYPTVEVVVVDDASIDDTVKVCEEYNVNVIKHPYAMGNGAAIKSGARAAKGDIFIFMDADGQHSPEDIQTLTDEINNGFDMVIGARSTKAHSSKWRYLGNSVYNRLASWITGHKIVDLTSGFRAVKADKFREFINILPNGFSYPTTITMAFFRVGYPVKYVSVSVKKDVGSSHIRLVRDGIRFLLIIFRIAALYSPLKIFFPISFALFSTGLGYYMYTYFTEGRFTNMSILILLTAIITFMIGLVSEQITFLIYTNNQKNSSNIK